MTTLTLTKNLFFSGIAMLWMSFSIHAYAEPMKFLVATTGGTMDGSVWIAADGEIDKDAPQRFLSLLQNYKFCNEVMFNSPGGNLLAAIKLGDIVRRRCKSTGVGATITSRVWSKSAAVTV